MTWRKAVLITILCVVSVVIILLIVTLCCCFRKFRNKSKNKKPNGKGKYVRSQSSENPTFNSGDDEPKQTNGQSNQSDISSGLIGHSSDTQGAVGSSEANGNGASEREDLRFDIQEKYRSDYKPAGELEKTTASVLQDG